MRRERILTFLEAYGGYPCSNSLPVTERLRASLDAVTVPEVSLPSKAASRSGRGWQAVRKVETKTRSATEPAPAGRWGSVKPTAIIRIVGAILKDAQDKRRLPNTRPVRRINGSVLPKSTTQHDEVPCGRQMFLSGIINISGADHGTCYTALASIQDLRIVVRPTSKVCLANP